MTTAEIKYDEANQLCVGIAVDEVSELLISDADISNFLYTIDRVKFKSIRIHKNNLRLVSDDEEVVITDINKFSRENGFARIPSIALQAKSVIAKYNRERAKNKRRRNARFGSHKIACASIVLGLLAISPIALNALHTDKGIQNEQTNDNNEDMLDAMIKASEIGTSVNYTFDNLKEKIDEDEIAQEEAEFGETPMIEQVAEQVMENIGNSAYLNYSLSKDTVKRENAYNLYHELVERFSNKWGISFNLIMAMLTQESGGFETNLMQIEFDDWDEEIIKVYNFEANRYEYFVLTNNPEEWAGQNVTCITEKDLENPITNISIGCVILRKSAEYMNYHVLAAVQCYNLGKGNMDKILELAAKESGLTIEEMLADQENIIFYQFTFTIDKGDPNYLSNVFAFLNDYGEVITFKHFDENNEIVEEVITIFSTQQEIAYHQ
ncbi:MAG: transglycosylase SLT domain-containing protein [Bacilli bacterium]|nr:transglycosylase SLT domain-containing protein [Bacilli bacterium]